MDRCAMKRSDDLWSIKQQKASETMRGGIQHDKAVMFVKTRSPIKHNARRNLFHRAFATQIASTPFFPSSKSPDKRWQAENRLDDWQGRNADRKVFQAFSCHLPLPASGFLWRDWALPKRLYLSNTLNGTLKMQSRSSEPLVSKYQTTRCHYPEG